MARSLNKVILIGNLTKDVELRYTPQGMPVASFGIATNRQWKVNDQLKESTEYHNIIAWNKLGELCSQLLVKGSRVYVEGRIQSRNWVDQNNVKHFRTEIVIDEMIYLGGKVKSEALLDDVAGAGYGSDSAHAENVTDVAGDLADLNVDEVLGQDTDYTEEDK